MGDIGAAPLRRPHGAGGEGPEPKCSTLRGSAFCLLQRSPITEDNFTFQNLPALLRAIRHTVGSEEKDLAGAPTKRMGSDGFNRLVTRPKKGYLSVRVDKLLYKWSLPCDSGQDDLGMASSVRPAS